MKKPIAFLRPDDLIVFSQNGDTDEYSLHELKSQYPENFHIAFPAKTLRALGFHEVFASEIPFQKAKQRTCEGT